VRTVIPNLVPVAAICFAATAHAQAFSLEEVFEVWDWDRDGLLTKVETKGSVPLSARFNDIDLNRDAIITREEMTNFLKRDTPEFLRNAGGAAPAVGERTASPES
jgi:hypothetical protein